MAVKTETFWNLCLDKGRLKQFLLWFMTEYGQHQTVLFLDQLKEFGFGQATRAGISLGIDDLMIPPKKAELLAQAEKESAVTWRQYYGSHVTGMERYQRLIQTWHQTSELLKQEVIRHFESTNLLNPVYMMAFSGARGNISQVRQLVGMRGLMSDPQGQILDFPIRSNFREGLTLTEYIISCYGARKGIVDTALRTANAGYLTRRLVDVAQHVVVSRLDCGTKRGVWVSDMNDGKRTLISLSQRLVGRVLAKNVYANPPSSSVDSVMVDESQRERRRIVLAKRNTEVSSVLAKKLSQQVKRVCVRSPLTCKIQKTVCQLCYGWSLSQARLVSIGEAVGVIAAQSIGEPGTQLTMRTFHTGGVFSSDASDQIKSPHPGRVEFTQPIPGRLIRTLDGRIGFCTKDEGTFRVVEAGVEGHPSETTFKIPVHTVLLVRHGQNVDEQQVLAFLGQNLSSKSTGRMEEGEQPLYATVEGEFYVRELDLLERETPSNDLIWQAWDWAYAWVLAGQIYHWPLPGGVWTRPGDRVTRGSALNRLDWYWNVSTPSERGYVFGLSTVTVSHQSLSQSEYALQTARRSIHMQQSAVRLTLQSLKYRGRSYVLQSNLNETYALALGFGQKSSTPLLWFPSHVGPIDAGTSHIVDRNRLAWLDHPVWDISNAFSVPYRDVTTRDTRESTPFTGTGGTTGGIHQVNRQGVVQSLSSNSIESNRSFGRYVLDETAWSIWPWFQYQMTEEPYGHSNNLDIDRARDQVTDASLTLVNFCGNFHTGHSQSECGVNGVNLFEDAILWSLDDFEALQTDNNAMDRIETESTGSTMQFVGSPTQVMENIQINHARWVSPGEAIWPGLSFDRHRVYLECIAVYDGDVGVVSVWRCQPAQESVLKDVHEQQASFATQMIDETRRSIFDRNTWPNEHGFVKQTATTPVLYKVDDAMWSLEAFEDGAVPIHIQSSDLSNTHEMRWDGTTFQCVSSSRASLPLDADVKCVMNDSTAQSQWKQTSLVAQTHHKSPHTGEIVRFFEKARNGERSQGLILTLEDQRRFIVPTDTNENRTLKVGDFITYGHVVNKKQALPEGGQLIHRNSNTWTLRRAQPVMVSAKALLHYYHGDFVGKDTPVVTLPFQRLKAGDIVQGIPKIEQYFEARATRQGRLFRQSLRTVLSALFRRYELKVSMAKAVRKSIYQIQQIVVDGIQRVYRSQGVTISDKHIEIIVRQMTKKVQIVASGRSGLIHGERVDLEWVESINRSLERPMRYRPVILGITRASLEVDSFLSAASFQQTTRTLSRAALYKKKDFLKGLKQNVIVGNLIPAGTGSMTR